MNTSVTPSTSKEGFYSLSVAQQSEVIDQFVEIQVDGMDWKTLAQIVTDNLSDYYGKCSYQELKEEIDNYDDVLFEELIDNVQIEDEDEKREHLKEIRWDRDID
tara:strand:+ start:192 stop:503 length:312 start_codon:yes stop_codon:yes gene_type:complete